MTALGVHFSTYRRRLYRRRFCPFAAITVMVSISVMVALAILIVPMMAP
jgi:hypothetical protein